jgi:hypothetical protein
MKVPVPSSQLKKRPTVGVTGRWASLHNVWEQKKLEAREMLENGARRGAAVPSVQCTLCWLAFCFAILYLLLRTARIFINFQL